MMPLVLTGMCGSLLLASILAAVIEQIQPKHYAPWERPHPLPPPPSRQRKRLLSALRVLVACLLCQASNQVMNRFLQARNTLPGEQLHAGRALELRQFLLERE